MDYQHMKIEHIIEWCKKNNQIDWLKETINKTFPTEDGERRISFIEVKRAFAQKFMPNIIPVAKPKKPSMYDLVNSL